MTPARRVRSGTENHGPAVKVKPIARWNFPGEPAPVPVLWMTVGSRWTAFTLDEAATLATALIDGIEELRHRP